MSELEPWTRVRTDRAAQGVVESIHHLYRYPKPFSDANRGDSDGSNTAHLNIILPKRLRLLRGNMTFLKELPVTKDTMRLLALLLVVQPLFAQEGTKAPYDTQKLTVPFTSAEDALAKMKMPPGFSATVFAAEPNLTQPIGFTIDERGRLWVVENNTYAERPLNFDTELRDRIVILEDADNDGVFDKRTIFWDQGVKMTSVEVGFGGVWVMAPPKLMFIPDADRDDVPDGPPQVLLNGFDDDVIRHNLANGLMWGPDGWLYGRHGIQNPSLVGKPGSTPSQRTNVTCGIWRFHPTRKEFQVVASGGTNPWGMDFDRHGEMFMINTVIGHLWHVVPGAYYRRMYGSHFNPYVYQIIEQTAGPLSLGHGRRTLGSREEEHVRRN